MKDKFDSVKQKWIEISMSKIINWIHDINWFGVSCIFCLTILLTIPSTNLNPTIYISLIPIGMIIIKYTFNNLKFFSLIKQTNKIEKLISFLLTMVFAIMLPVYNIFSFKFTDLKNVNILYCIFCVIVFLVSSFWVLLSVISKKETVNEITEIQQEQNKQYKKYFYIIVAISLVFIISCYPGIMHGDGWNTWNEVIGKTKWTDWHPIGYIFFCWLCSLIWKNPFSVIVIQTLIWVYVNYYILYFLNKYKGIYSCKVYTILSLIAIQSYSYLHVLYKDSIFNISFLGYTIFLIMYLQGERTKKLYRQLIVFAIMASLMRHMMIIPILIPLVILFIINSKEKNRKEAKRMLIFMLCIVLLYGGIRESIFKITLAERNPKYVKYTVALEMMAAYAYYGNVDEKSKMFLEGYIPLEKWAEAYSTNPFKADTIARYAYNYLSENQLDDLGSRGIDILKMNWKFMTKFPGKYFGALMKQNILCWRMSDISDNVIAVQPRFINAEAIVEEKNPEYNPQHNYITEVLEPIVVFSFSNPIWKSLGYYAGCSIFALFICIGIMLNRKKWTYLLGMIPTIILDILLAFSIPMQDSRYIMPIVQVGILYMAIFSDSFFRNTDNTCSIEEKGKKVLKVISLVLVIFVVVMFIKDKLRLYQATLLNNTQIVFENKKAIKKSDFFEQMLMYDDQGVWFPTEYSMKIPFRVNKDLVLSFEGYCCDSNEKIEIYVNGEYVDLMKKENEEANITSYYCNIPKEYFHGKEQVVEFKANPEIMLITENEDGISEEYRATFYAKKINFIIQ